MIKKYKSSMILFLNMNAKLSLGISWYLIENFIAVVLKLNFFFCIKKTDDIDTGWNKTLYAKCW